MPPKQTTTDNFGFLKRFYGDPESDADQSITSFENSIQGFVQDARRMEDGQPLPADKCAALVSHLEMRSLFLRAEMSRLGERFFTKLKEKLLSRSVFEKLMITYLQRNPHLIETELTRVGAEGDARVALRELLDKQIRSTVSTQHSKIRPGLESLLDNMCRSIAEKAKDAHMEALRTNFFEVERAVNHRVFSFRIVKSCGIDFILPDTCLAFLKANTSVPVSQKDDKTDAVLLPISSDTAIVGIHPNGAFKKPPETINRILAGCAYEAFVSRENSASLVALSSRISKNARMMSDAEINQALQIEKFTGKN